MSHISYSEFKEWVNCPWKHKLVYLDKIKQFNGNEHTAFGTALHTVCEHMVYEKPIDYKALFEEEFLMNLQRIKTKTPNFSFNAELISSMREQGQYITDFILPALKGYFGAFEIVEVEEKLYEDIAGDEKKFKGFIDLVVKTKDGKHHIIDWKTCGWGWEQRKKSDKMITYQLTLYKHFWCKKHNVDPNSVQTHFALLKRTAKRDNVEIFKVTSGTKKTENALKLLHKSLYNINRKNYVKNKLACHGRYGVCEFYKSEHCQ